MTATEASRAFSALLDAVEAGETVTIERAGRRVAVVEPVVSPNGRQVKALLENGVDPAFASDLSAVRRAVETDPWPWPDA